MNKYYYTLIASIALIISVSALGFYYSFVRTVEKKQEKIIVKIDELKDISNLKQAKSEVKDNDKLIEASSSEQIVKDYTLLTINRINISDNTSNTINTIVPDEYIGLTRDQLLEKIDDNNGEENIIETSLQSFSESEIKIVEKYKEKSDIVCDNKYFIKANSNIIYVFEEDMTTVYENTGIDISKFPIQEIKNLNTGFWVKDKEELISILESYSS